MFAEPAVDSRSAAVYRSRAQHGESVRIRWRAAAALVLQCLCFTAAAVVLQFAAGAYRAEFAGYPDEPAHVVTSIMLDQFVRSPAHWLSPMHFVEDYYLHYPKVAMGHWPPLLYVVNASATLLFGRSRITLLLVEAGIAGLLATAVYRVTVRECGVFIASAAALSLLAMREVQTHTSMVMAEMLLTFTMFRATLAFAQFSVSESWRDAVAFGLWTSAAILTKGTGWALLPVAAAVVVLTGRWTLVRKIALWASAGIIALLCLPWQFATRHMVSAGWDAPAASLNYSMSAALELTRSMFSIPGVPMAAAALAGGALCLAYRRKDRVWPLAASLTALIAVDWLFHVVVPAGRESRRVVIAMPALTALAALGAVTLARRFAPKRMASAGAMVLFALLCASVAWRSLPLTPQPEYGYVAAGRALMGMMPYDTAALVSSDSFGEGALIAEAAMLDPNPHRYVVRATKLLASVSWSGQNLRLIAKTDQECGRLLRSVPISFIVFDRRREAQSPYQRALQSYLASHTDLWTLAGEFAGRPGEPAEVAIYRSNEGISPVRHLVVDLKPTLGRDLALPR